MVRIRLPRREEPVSGPINSIATLRAVTSWLFFCVARSLRIDSDMLVARALKNSRLTDGESHAIYGTGPLNGDFNEERLISLT